MRIVGGRHRGRRLLPPMGRDVRPTSDRLRESLFNILAHSDWGPGDGPLLEDASVLDGFCGTGALGLEAMSRGAERAAFLDRNRDSLNLARRNAETVGETGRCRFLLGDALRPPPALYRCGLVFLDPPYGEGLVPPALTALARAGWLLEGAVVCCEVAADEVLVLPEGFIELDARKYGAGRVAISRWTGGAA